MILTDYVLTIALAMYIIDLVNINKYESKD